MRLFQFILILYAIVALEAARPGVQSRVHDVETHQMFVDHESHQSSDSKNAIIPTIDKETFASASQLPVLDLKFELLDFEFFPKLIFNTDIDAEIPLLFHGAYYYLFSGLSPPLV